MERSEPTQKAHVLLLPYPAQGHINPILQFGKRLASHGLTVTIAITRFIAKSTKPKPGSPVRVEEISDGYDDGGFAAAESIHAYLDRFTTAGSKTLVELIDKLRAQGSAINCIVYDPFLPWGLEVAKELGLFGASFFTQPCLVSGIYYHVHRRNLAIPATGPTVSLEGLPQLELGDLPPFVSVPGHLPAYMEMVIKQFSNLEKADFVFFNTFYELEDKAVDWMTMTCRARPIGPTVPSFYLDKRVKGDDRYGFDLYTTNNSLCMNWLDSKPTGSVVYAAFGSRSELKPEQMEELGWGLKASNKSFLLVVRATEEGKLPENFLRETSPEKGLVVSWCNQLEVLSHRAVGCFVTHCGWNSTLEALSLGVPMIGVPHWADQPTNAKCVKDLWGVGVRAKADDEGIVRREEMEFCIREVMEGEKAEEMKKNAEKWRELAVEAVSEGGSSDKNIQNFIQKLVCK